MNIGGIDKYREMTALNVAKLPKDTRTQAAILIDRGLAQSADEAVDKVKSGSFADVLKQAMTGGAKPQ